MNIISHDSRYLPHEFQTRLNAVKLYRNGYKSSYICRKYHISKASLSRWNNRFDASKESLLDKSHKPLSPHPNSHTPLELKWISDFLRRSPNLTFLELYGSLRIKKGYSRHPVSLYRVMKRLGYYKKQIYVKNKYKPKPYDTPSNIGIKWQIDTKYVPDFCKASSLPEDIHFYQYTCIDEASRERFIYHYEERNSHNSIDFLYRCFNYFSYKPEIVQTDNGFEFTFNHKTNKDHLFTLLCRKEHILHQTIRPRTPRHNGKVERSHRNDNKRFYEFLKFYSLDDLRYQAKLYLNRSNNTPMFTLNFLTPIQKRIELLSFSS
ncbi:MAG: DDE-type integrase/transposase/recombinase [Bacilli bacterium]